MFKSKRGLLCFAIVLVLLAVFTGAVVAQTNGSAYLIPGELGEGRVPVMGAAQFYAPQNAEVITATIEIGNMGWWMSYLPAIDLPGYVCTLTYSDDELNPYVGVWQCLKGTGGGSELVLTGYVVQCQSAEGYIHFTVDTGSSFLEDTLTCTWNHQYAMVEWDSTIPITMEMSHTLDMTAAWTNAANIEWDSLQWRWQYGTWYNDDDNAHWVFSPTHTGLQTVTVEARALFEGLPYPMHANHSAVINVVGNEPPPQASVHIGGAPNVGGGGTYGYSSSVVVDWDEDFSLVDYEIKIAACSGQETTVLFPDAGQSVGFDVTAQGVCDDRIVVTSTVMTSRGAFSATKEILVVENVFEYTVKGPEKVLVGTPAEFSVLANLPCEEPENPGSGTELALLDEFGDETITFVGDVFSSVSFTPTLDLIGSWGYRTDATCLVTSPTGWPDYTLYNKYVYGQVNIESLGFKTIFLPMVLRWSE